MTTKKRKHINENTLRTRLIDAKNEYDCNKSFIELYESLVENGEPITTDQVRDFKEFQKLNLTLRKQINEMELMLDATGDEENPFK